jgi:hypothetical protein
LSNGGEIRKRLRIGTPRVTYGFPRFMPHFLPIFSPRAKADTQEIVVIADTLICRFPSFNSQANHVDLPVTFCYGV